MLRSKKKRTGRDEMIITFVGIEVKGAWELRIYTYVKEALKMILISVYTSFVFSFPKPIYSLEFNLWLQRRRLLLRLLVFL